jgi:simple sugar transport system permease protein
LRKIFLEEAGSLYQRRALRYLLIFLEPMTAFAIATLINAFILYLLRYDPLEVYSVMFLTGYSDIHYLFIKSSPYIATGLAFSTPFLAGIFNIGGEGQLYVGALTALLASYVSRNFLISILTGSIAGALLSGLIAFLRVYRNVNEVVTAIMLNWIMYYITSYIITVYIYDPFAPYQSRPVPREAVINPDLMFIISVFTALIIYIVLFYTSIGYMMRVVGRSFRSAVYSGINIKRIMILSMMIGGGSAGLGGALIPLGTSPHVLDNTMSALYGVGFMGIGIGLLGRNNPIGIIIASIFISGLIIGGQNVERIIGAPPEVVDVIIGITIVMLAIPYILRNILAKRGVYI